MKITKIVLENFRQYQDTNEISLETFGERNIVLIGGKNGYGKTNFLMSLVWCLYGEDISKIDENFRREIQKEGSYAKYLKGSLNWSSEKLGISKFSVEIEVAGIELPEAFDIKKNKGYKCKLKRSFDVATANEQFDIVIDGIKFDLFSDPDSKRLFVNDYLIPIDAAKFVFFDAEKIAGWAELSTKEEGSVLNDALGKILGLDVYETLVLDLQTYIDGLRKESATSVVKQQINSVEKGIQHNIEEIEKKESEIIEKDIQLVELKDKILHYESFLSKHQNKFQSFGNLDELYRVKHELLQRERELEDSFNQMSEVLPFAISAGKIEEVVEHIIKQETREVQVEKQKELVEKGNILLERLFNSPPFPTDGDMSFSKKMFYAEKAKKLIEVVFGSSEIVEDLPFEHDLNKSDKEFIKDAFSFIAKQSRESFEQTIDSYLEIKSQILESERMIRKIEADQQDEEIIRYTNNKSDTQRRVEKNIEEKGAIQNQIAQLRKIVDSDNQRLSVLLKKIEVSEQKRKKLEKANQYIKALRSFIEEQKRNKCSVLESGIYDEMQKLMHKLQDKSNDNFVAGVKAEPLPDNEGLKITLLDKDGYARQKESLSQGEKQVYISSLIKAILSLSVQEFPIFIDTPLGRMDDEHIKNILLNYYPDLAGQVVLMATNNEIPPSRFRMMEVNVAQTYLLESRDNRTYFKKGYFQSYEN